MYNVYGNMLPPSFKASSCQSFTWSKLQIACVSYMLIDWDLSAYLKHNACPMQKSLNYAVVQYSVKIIPILRITAVLSLWTFVSSDIW